MQNMTLTLKLEFCKTARLASIPVVCSELRHRPVPQVDEICLSFFSRCVFSYCSVVALDSKGVSACLIISSDMESSKLPDI